MNPSSRSVADPGPAIDSGFRTSHMGAPIDSRTLDACFVPFDQANPYQTLLARALDPLGITVRTDVQRDDLKPGAKLPQVVHLHWLRELSLRPRILRWAFRRVRNLRGLVQSGKQLVWTAHNLVPHESKHGWLQRWHSRQVAKLCSGIIAHSPTSRLELLRNLGSSLDPKIHVIPHGHYMDCYPNSVSGLESRRRLGLPEGTQILLFLGVIRPYKGLQELIQVWSALPAPRPTLVIAGRPVNEAASRSLREIAGGREGVIVREGFVPDGDVQYYMQSADAVVFPYRRIFTSGAVVLAMSFGKACVAPRIGSIQDYLSDDGAFLYDVNQVDGLDAALRSAVLKRDSLAAMGDHNRQRAARWDWNSIARATREVYLGSPPANSTRWWE